MSKSPPRRHNWAAIAGVHAVAALALALVVAVIEHRSHALVSAAEVVAIVLAVAVAVAWMLTRKRKALRKQAKKLAGHHAVRTAVLAWAGVGLALAGLSGVVAFLKPSGHAVSLSDAVLAGLFAAPTAARASGSVSLFVLAAIGWVGSAAWLLVAHHEIFRGDGRMILSKATKLARSNHAPEEKPSGAHFASVTKGLDAVVVPRREQDNRLLLGTAELAPDWGQRLRTVQVALAQEGSAILFGGPGSGKSTLFQTILLSSRRPRSDEKLLPTRFIVLSTKPRDLAGPTVEWLRQQGPVAMWDLTGKTVSSDRYGDPIRWSPLQSVSDWDSAKRLAKKLVEAGREADSRERDSFWLQQAMSLIAPALLAAARDGQEYATALSWAQQWTTAAFATVDRVLEAHDEVEALHTWRETRKMLLTEAKDGGWEENRGAAGAAATGLSINATLSGLLLSLSSASARAATHDPNFDPRAWVRGDGPAALFLVGDWQAPEMTRSLLVPLVNELLDSAYSFATEQDTERLPYRLVVLGDELANLAPIEGLERYFSTARSHGIQLLAAFQSYGQVEQAYGRHVARTLVDASAATVVLSGIRDRDLIAMLGQAGGSEHVEVESETKSGDTTSKTTSKQARTLLEGHEITRMRGPTPDRPGDGLLLIPGAVIKIRIPLWARVEPFCRRGTPHPDHAEAHAAHLAQLDRQLGALARRAWRTVASMWTRETAEDAAAPAAGASARPTSKATPEIRREAAMPSTGSILEPGSVEASELDQQSPHSPAPPVATRFRRRRTRAVGEHGEPARPPAATPARIASRLSEFRTARAELQEAVAAGAASEEEAAAILACMAVLDGSVDLEWGISWDTGEARCRRPGDEEWQELAS